MRIENNSMSTSGIRNLLQKLGLTKKESQLKATLPPVKDPETGITGYEYAISNDPNGKNIQWIQADVTPPSQPTVTVQGVYANSSLSELKATWSASEDQESGIMEYQYAISTDPNDPESGNVVPWTSAGTNPDATVTGLSLMNGTTYYVHVKAINGDGMSSEVSNSDGINIDTKVPK